MTAVRAVLAVAGMYVWDRLWDRKALDRPRGMRRRLFYELGYLRFLWRAEAGQIGFREDELEQLAKRLSHGNR